MLPQIHRFLSPRAVLAPFALATLLAPALVPAAALADSKEIAVVNLVSKQLAVDSNGSSYHMVSHLANLVADVRIVVDTGEVGRVKSWKAWLGLSNGEGAYEDYKLYFVAKEYPWGKRPRHVNRIERIIVPSGVWANFVKARCNALAAELRAQGLGDTAIFGQDRHIELGVPPFLDTETTGAGSGNLIVEAVPFGNLSKLDLVCKKWPGAAIPQASSDITIGPAEVVATSLSVAELSSLGGACKIRLDGSITTDRGDAEVSFRYRDQAGKESQVWKVNTGASKTASFSHWYDIPNNPDGDETGFVRMVGVSHEFLGDWRGYALKCVEGGPGTLATNEPPKLSMTVAEQGKVMVHGQICPESLKLMGLLDGRGNMSGRTIFFGPGFLSPPRDYSIKHGQKILVGADAPLNWKNVPPPVGNALLKQERRFTFNATNENDKVVSSLKNQQHMVTCVRPAVNPVVGQGGGLTVEPRQPAAPTAVPRSLQPQPATPGTVPQPVSPRVILQQRQVAPAN